MSDKREHVGSIADADHIFCDAPDCWCAYPAMAKENEIPLIHGRTELELHDAAVRRKALEEAALLAERYCCGCCCPEPHLPKTATGEEPCDGYFNLPEKIRALAEKRP